MLNDLELGQLLTAKLCHDLAGVLGGLNNSIDFLKMDDDRIKNKALDLLFTSSKQSIAKLQFYRYAYGTPNAPGEANLEKIDSLCHNFLHGTKSSLTFHKNYFNNPDLFICNNSGKAIMCLVELAMNALIHGGDIRVDIQRTETGKVIVVTASGPLVKINTEKDQVLQGKVDGESLNIYNIHSYYTHRLIELVASSFQIKYTEESVTYILNCDIKKHARSSISS